MTEPALGTLRRDAFGQLVIAVEGVGDRVVVPVRAFPIAAPEEGIALIGSDGHELIWIERLKDLPEPQRAVVEEELAARTFLPEIHRIVCVSGYVTPCTWRVRTDHGETQFVLKAEEAIRRLPPSGLLITDSRGISFQVRDTRELDQTSRKVLDRFL